MEARIAHSAQGLSHGLDEAGSVTHSSKHFSPKVHTDSGVHPTSYSMGTGSCFLSVQQPKHEAEESLPSSVQVKTRGAIPLFPLQSFVAQTGVMLPLTFYTRLYSRSLILYNLLPWLCMRRSDSWHYAVTYSPTFRRNLPPLSSVKKKRNAVGSSETLIPTHMSAKCQ